MTDMPWKDKISNHNQVGGIETSVVDNGLGRGVRIAWINTGSGLRFKLVLDRAMDIYDAFYNQHSLAWISHSGITAPNPAANYGLEWLKTFGGGLLTTCGMSHVGGPEEDEHGKRGLHDLVSNLPAEIESITQPDPIAGKLNMSITAKIRQTTVFGPHLELRRTISSTLGQSNITIHDEVTNRGNTPVSHMMLYHCNFGWPLIDEGTDIIWQGQWVSRDSDMDRSIFNNDNDFRKCPPPLDAHSGFGEACAFIDTAADSDGLCRCGLYNSKLDIGLTLQFKNEQLPWLTNWQHWGKGEYVTALEPGTNPPIGQAKARQQNELIHIAPGQSVQYDLEMNVLDSEESINDLMALKKY